MFNVNGFKVRVLAEFELEGFPVNICSVGRYSVFYVKYEQIGG